MMKKLLLVSVIAGMMAGCSSTPIQYELSDIENPCSRAGEESAYNGTSDFYDALRAKAEKAPDYDEEVCEAAMWAGRKDALETIQRSDSGGSVSGSGFVEGLAVFLQAMGEAAQKQAVEDQKRFNRQIEASNREAEARAMMREEIERSRYDWRGNQLY